jgi:hypothetical protein
MKPVIIFIGKIIMNIFICGIDLPINPVTTTIRNRIIITGAAILIADISNP